MTADPTTTARRYAFGWPEDRSLIAGLAVHQVVIGAVGAVAGLAAVLALPSAAGLLLGVAALAAATAIGSVPVAGHTVPAWVRLGSAYAISWRARRRGPAPLPAAGFVDAADPIPPPQPLKGVRIVGHPVGDTTVGVVADDTGASWTALLVVGGGGHQLADLADKQRRQAMWGQVLAALARTGSPIARVQWVERIVPDDGDATDQWLATNAAVDADHPARASYTQLLAAAVPVASRHEVTLAVAIDSRRARTAIAAAGGGDTGAATVLCREVVALADQLAAADLTVDGILGPRRVAHTLRAAFDPTAVRSMSRLATAAGDPPGSDPAGVWPLATSTAWDAYTTDGMVHATYWIAHWPRRDVPADFLAPLLVGTTCLRAVSVTLEPIPPDRAIRAADAAAVKHDSDDAVRAKGGWTVTARRRRQADQITQRADELAAGHADYRCVGLVVVTAATADDLATACGQVEQHAHQAQLELRRLYGRQDTAFAAALPLARRVS